MYVCIMNLDPNLIKEFANVPAFYNKTSVNYKDKVYTERAWKSISIKLGHPVSELKERMYQLRNRYNLEKRKLESLRYEGIAEPISSWSLYQYLTFLDGHIRPRKSYKSMIARNSDDNDDSYYDLKSAMLGGRSVINHNVIGSISAPVTPGVIGGGIASGVTTSGGGGIGSGQRGRPRKNPINPTIVRTGRRGRPPKRLIECDDSTVKMSTIKNINYNNLHNSNNSNINNSNTIMHNNNNNNKNNNINNKNINHQHNNQINQMVEVKYEPQDDVMNDNCNNGNNSDVVVDDNHDTINHLDNVDNINNRNLVNNNADGGGSGGGGGGSGGGGGGGGGGGNNAIDMVRIYANGNCVGDGGDGNNNLARGVHGGQDYDSSNDNELKNDSNEYVNPIHFLVDSESEHGNHASEVHHRRPQRTNENNSRNLVSIRNINSLKRHPIQSVDELCQYQNRPIKCARMHQKLPPADKFETYGNFVSASLADLPEQVAFGLMEKFTSDIIKALMDKSINNNNAAAILLTTAAAAPPAPSASHQQSVNVDLHNNNNNNNNNDNRLSTTSQTIAPTTSSASSTYSS